MTTRELIDQLLVLQEDGDISDFDLFWFEPVAETWSEIEEIQVDRASGTIAFV